MIEFNDVTKTWMPLMLYRVTLRFTILILKISVAVISELVQREKITPQQALKAVKKISHIREWQGGVLQVLARKYFPQL
ncbi:MAG: hypothetical protein ACOC6H_04715 [Thermoproteota archaeon]